MQPLLRYRESRVLMLKPRVSSTRLNVLNALAHCAIDLSGEQHESYQHRPGFIVTVLPFHAR